MIELAGVSFAYAGGAPVLADANLAVAGGEVVLLGGAAGAGTSTIMGLLAGRLEAAGRVAIAGRDLVRLRERSRVALRRRIGPIPQELALIDDATARENVALALEVSGVARRWRTTRAELALTTVDVAPGALVSSLSMAARQRVAWARALVRSPDILIADQPTSHQDADRTERFATLVSELAAGGAACVVLARDPHLVAEAMRRGWRIFELAGGQITEWKSARRGASVDAAEGADREVAEAAPVGAIDELPRAGTPPPAVSAEAESSTAAARDGADPIDFEAVPNVVPFPRARSAGVEAR